MVLAGPPASSSTPEHADESSDHVDECEEMTDASRRPTLDKDACTFAQDVTADAEMTISASDKLLELLQNEIRSIRELINCKICYSPLYEPYTTSCGHTFCYGCLCKTFDPDRSKNCPECRTELETAPAPAFTLREITHRLIKHSEFLGEDETVEGHSAQVREHDALVKEDRNTVTGLFKGLFADTQPLCPYCDGKLVYGICTYCGYRTDFESGSSTQDTDAMSEQTMSDENDEDFDMEDVDHGFDGELPADAYAEESEIEARIPAPVIGAETYRGESDRTQTSLPARLIAGGAATIAFATPRVTHYRRHARRSRRTEIARHITSADDSTNDEYEETDEDIHEGESSENDDDDDDEEDEEEDGEDDEDEDDETGSEAGSDDVDHCPENSSDASSSTASDSSVERYMPSSNSGIGIAVSEDAADALAQSVAQVLDNVQRHLANTTHEQDPITQPWPYASAPGTTSRRRQRETTPTSSVGQARRRRRVNSRHRLPSPEIADLETESVMSTNSTASSSETIFFQHACIQESSQDERSESPCSCCSPAHDSNSDSAETTIGIGNTHSSHMISRNVTDMDRSSSSRSSSLNRARAPDNTARVAISSSADVSATSPLMPTIHRLTSTAISQASSSTTNERQNSLPEAHQQNRRPHLTRSQSSQSNTTGRNPQRLVDRLAQRNAADRLAVIEAQRLSSDNHRAIRDSSLRFPSTRAHSLAVSGHDLAASGADARAIESMRPTQPYTGFRWSELSDPLAGRGNLAEGTTSSSAPNSNGDTRSNLHRLPQQRPGSNNPFMRYLADGSIVQTPSQFNSPPTRGMRADQVSALPSSSRSNGSHSAQTRQLNHTPSMMRLPQSVQTGRNERMATISHRATPAINNVRISPGHSQVAMNRRISDAMNARAALIASRPVPSRTADNAGRTSNAPTQQAARNTANNPFRVPRRSSDAQAHLQRERNSATLQPVAPEPPTSMRSPNRSQAREASVRAHFSPFSATRRSRLATASANPDPSFNGQTGRNHAASTSFLPASALHSNSQGRLSGSRPEDANHTLSFLRMSLSGSGFPYT